MGTVTVVYLIITAILRQMSDIMKVSTVCQSKLNTGNGIKMEESARTNIVKGCVILLLMRAVEGNMPRVCIRMRKTE